MQTCFPEFDASYLFYRDPMLNYDASRPRGLVSQCLARALTSEAPRVRRHPQREWQPGDQQLSSSPGAAVIGHWTGRWSLGAGDWALVTGRWSVRREGEREREREALLGDEAQRDRPSFQQTASPFVSARRQAGRPAGGTGVG